MQTRQQSFQNGSTQTQITKQLQFQQCIQAKTAVLLHIFRNNPKSQHTTSAKWKNIIVNQVLKEASSYNSVHKMNRC